MFTESQIGMQVSNGVNTAPQVAERMLATKKHFDLDTTVLQTRYSDVFNQFSRIWISFGVLDIKRTNGCGVGLLIQDRKGIFRVHHDHNVRCQVNGLYCLALLSASSMFSLRRPDLPGKSLLVHSKSVESLESRNGVQGWSNAFSIFFLSSIKS